MTISKFNKIFLALIAVILMSACKNWLDIQPEDGLIRQKYWKSEAQVRDAVIGCYSSMMDNDNFVWYLFQWGEVRSDMVANATGTTESLKEQIEGMFTPNDAITNWGMVYKTINLCNTILKFGKDAQKEDQTFTWEKLKTYESEAWGLRALMYFYLVRTFGDVPLKLDASVDDNQEYFIEKSTQNEVLKQVVADLDSAEKYAVSSFGRNDYDKGRITKYTIWAIQADVALWNEEYQKCIDYCNKIELSGNFGLIAGGGSWFQTLFVDGNSNESIFELQYNTTKLNQLLFYNFSPFTSMQQIRASLMVYNYYFMPDELNPELSDIRGDGGAFNANNMSIWKYIGSSTKGVQRDVSQANAHWIFYRLADIKLLKAEALTQLNMLTEAFSIVKEIRTRAQALTSTDFKGDSADVRQVTKYVLDERARELAFEGKRWFDLLRFGKRNRYEMLNTMINIVTTNVPPAKITTVINRYKDVRSHYLPINYTEITRNYKLEQNPFYETIR